MKLPKRNVCSSASGVTFIELILVVSLISVVAVMAAPFYARMIRQNDTWNTYDQLAGSLRKAHIYSMQGKQDSAWGVRFDTSPRQIVLFKVGSSVFDEKYPVSANVAVNNFSTITFGRLNGIPTAGTPSTTPTITVSSGNTTKTITINAQGVISK